MNVGLIAPALRSHVCCLVLVAVTTYKRAPVGALLFLTVTSAADSLSISHNLTTSPPPSSSCLTPSSPFPSLEPPLQATCPIARMPCVDV